jgi:PEP-CTERM motif
MVVGTMSHKYLVVILAALPAWAGTITISNDDLSRGSYVDFLANGVRTNSFAGVIRGAYDFGSLLDLLSADPYRYIGPGTYYSTRFGAPVGAGLNRVAWLYDYQLITVTTAASGAGLQLAMWDLIADQGDGPGAGYLKAAPGTPQAVIDAWRNYLAISAGQASPYANFYRNHDINGVYLETLIGPGSVAPPPLIVIEPPPPTGGDVVNPPIGQDVSVPEPSTISLMLAGLLALAAMKLRG